MSKFHSKAPGHHGAHGRWNTSSNKGKGLGYQLMSKEEHEWYKQMIHVNSPIRKRLRRSRFKHEYDTTYETYGEWYDPDVWCRAPRADTGLSWNYHEERQLNDITPTGNVEYGNFYNKLTNDRLRAYTHIKRFPRHTALTEGREEESARKAKVSAGQKTEEVLPDEAPEPIIKPSPPKTKRRKWTVVETNPLRKNKLPPVQEAKGCAGKCNCECKGKQGADKKSKTPAKSPPREGVVKKESKLPQIEKIHIGMTLKNGGVLNINAQPEKMMLVAK